MGSGERLKNGWNCIWRKKQYVSVNNVNSKEKFIICGVPQGSVLGPLLFLIYINDLQNCLKYCKSYIFADDNASNIFHKSLKTFKKRLNIDLKMIYHWLNSNKIKFQNWINSISTSNKKSLLRSENQTSWKTTLFININKISWNWYWSTSRLDQHQDHLASTFGRQTESSQN